jgi:AcrR family transcriptional regulator
MSEEDLTTQARILDSTVKLLLAAPTEELTTRRIAAEAQVNIAAINYYFRSKEELVDRAMEAAVKGFFEKGLAVLLAPGRDPVDRLRDFFTGYAYGLMNSPRLSRTAYLGLVSKDDSTTFFGGYMKDMLVKIMQVVAEARGEGEEGARAIADTSLMALSCVVFPFLLSNILREAGAVDYSDDDARRRYIDTVLTRLVGEGKEENRNG